MVTSLATRLSALLAHIWREEDGQGLAEYALILTFIAVVAVAALVFIGTTISSLISLVGQGL
jgi:Flp pilus assembly pilin Flp